MGAAKALSGAKPRVAILDDYQNAALRYGPRSLVEADVEVFSDHLHDERALIERLRPFDVVCLMRERTPFGAGVIDDLPRLKLIVSTAMWNAALDSEHATNRGIAVSGTRSVKSGTPEHTWLLILALARRFSEETASLLITSLATAPVIQGEPSAKTYPLRRSYRLARALCAGACRRDGAGGSGSAR